MAFVEGAIPKRPVICRLCGVKLDSNTLNTMDTPILVLRSVHVSPKHVDLWFCTNCGRAISETVESI